MVLDVDISDTNTLYFFVKNKTRHIKRYKSIKQKTVNKPRVVSMRRKLVSRQLSGNGNTKPRPGAGKLAWWQQASTDTSEWETEVEDNDNEDCQV